ncbi:MAG: hypothetical protein VCD00_04505 [Candidatus Hydrogenedentota bacterium]
MSNRYITVALRAVASFAILAVAYVLFGAIIRSKEPAAQVEIPEQALRVDILEATFRDVPVLIEGLGEMRARDVVQVASEVAGLVTAIHPHLEVGGIIPAGEVLFEIDARDYEALAVQSSASVDQLSNSIRRLTKQYAIDKERLKTFERTRGLAKGEFERVKSLYEKDKVGTQSQVDNAEMGFNNANDAYDQLSQSIDLFPIRIEEAKNALTSSQAMADLAATNLARTKVSVTFDARIKSVTLERGQFVSPGAPILTLADDSLLEITIPLDSRVARKWLKFQDSTGSRGTAWFGQIQKVPVTIGWTGDQGKSQWKGTLERVEKFDQQTRQTAIVARVTAQDANRPTSGDQPLVEGMFCKIAIPGKTAHNVVEVPLECVSFSRDDEGYRSVFVAKTAEDGRFRLDSIRVRESHIAGESIFLSEGIDEGTMIVTTRLINPLPNSLLNTQVIPSAETD